MMENATVEENLDTSTGAQRWRLPETCRRRHSSAMFDVVTYISTYSTCLMYCRVVVHGRSWLFWNLVEFRTKIVGYSLDVIDEEIRELKAISTPLVQGED